MRLICLITGPKENYQCTFDVTYEIKKKSNQNLMRHEKYFWARMQSVHQNSSNYVDTQKRVRK